MWLRSVWFRAAVSVMVLLTWSVTSSECGAGCNRRWCKYGCMQCMNSSVALAQWKLASVHGCVLKASSSADDLVVQWNKQTGVCSLFHYQHVCRLMQVPDGAGIGATSHCSCYRTAALVSCAASLNAHLLGVWLAGGSSRFSNLLCQSEPTNYRLIGFNLQWTEEGANFDGVSSYALLNDSRFVAADTSAGFTWLIRLKRRQSKFQGFLELEACSRPELFRTSFLEAANGKLYFTWRGNDPPNFNLFSDAGLLPSSPDSFIDLAVSIGSNVSQSGLFFQSGFTPAVVAALLPEQQDTCYALQIGRLQWGTTNYMLNGTVRAVAIANGSLTEQQIRDFFALLP